MKRIILLFILLIPLCCGAQDYLMKIPNEGGKIVFKDSISIEDYLDKKIVKDKVLDVLNAYLADKRGLVRLNDTINNQMVIQVIDYMEIEKKSLYLFALWAKYILFVDYSKDKCLIEVRNIVFVEPNEKNTKDPDKYNDFAFSAEDVFFFKKYKVTFVEDATNKIAGHFINNMNSLFSSMRSELK